jgi:excisionase family DNA binding protein
MAQSQAVAYLTVTQVAKILGVHYRTVIIWCKTKQLPHTRIGRLYRFTMENLSKRLQGKAVYHGK